MTLFYFIFDNEFIHLVILTFTMMKDKLFIVTNLILMNEILKKFQIF